jgi:outer membrane protein OmpA-like peptidoglycan-associated protein
MREAAILRSGLAACLLISLGGCATDMSPGICAAIGGGLGAVGGGVGGGIYSHEHHRRDHEQLEGAGIAAASAIGGAAVGYLVCHLMGDDEPEPRRAPPPPPPAPRAAPPAPPAREPDACTTRVRLEDVTFGNDKSDISPQAAAVLDELVGVLKSCPDQRVRLDAHTDSVGSEEYNRALSQRRADSVRSHLISRGIAAGRIEARGLGESNPVASNDTAEGRAQNRRVEIEPIL